MEDHQSSNQLILIKCEPNVIATVTINKPKSINSLIKSMMIDLAKAFKSLNRNESVRVIILTGSGRAFSFGVDLTSAEDVFKGDVKILDEDLVHQMELCRKPIIGAINGFAITAGFEIALACDILIASKSAQFIDTNARFGIFPSWGLSQKLLKKARDVAAAIVRNKEDLVLRYKSVINGGLKLDLGHALALEKVWQNLLQSKQKTDSTVSHAPSHPKNIVPGFKLQRI